MKISKTHFALIIFEVISIVLSLAGLTFLILTLVVNHEFFKGFMNLEWLFMVGPGAGFLLLYGLASLLIVLVSLVFTNFIGLIYSVEFPLFGLSIGTSLFLIRRMIFVPYTANGLILAIVTLSLALLVFLSSLAFFILFIFDSIGVLKYRIVKHREKKANKLLKKEEKNVEAKPAEIKEETPVVEEPIEEEKPTEEDKEDKPTARVYHISQHPTANKWQVKLAKGERALKLFDTQAEAIAYAKEIVSKQGGSIRLHSKKGKMRSL